MFIRHKHKWVEKARYFTNPLEEQRALYAIERFGFTTIEYACACGADRFVQHTGRLLPTVLRVKDNDG